MVPGTKLKLKLSITKIISKNSEDKNKPTIDNIESTSDNLNKEQPNTINHTPKTTLPPPIFIKGALVYIGLLNHFKQIIGPNIISC
ncbi:Uncharacterized protein FWK35_00023256 [Aphis craccivora]|uniref:Uncharacterized protein n=1 Tax=Aphis craccivora TaxID=307492 RepID=A0A6G0YUZ0_APHCR|nr:Uncharacterized protein FWK35_00023256 [Aphis craccivora]